MDVEIDLEKSLEGNASAYFEKSKRAKRKLQGLRKAIVEMEERLGQVKEKPKRKQLAKKRKRQWFQAFHWFKTSQGFLVIGGKDARSNETAVKKHLGEGDLFLHADIQGAAACILKAGNKKVDKESQKEAAQFAAVRSKAWQQNLASVDVYAVSKKQVSKKAPSGESLPTGAFMVYGKRQWFKKTPLLFALGLLPENSSLAVMGGSPTAVKKHCIGYLEIVPGKQKKSDVAKTILRLFEQKTGKKQPVHLDEIVAVLPSENLAIKEQF